MIHLLAVALWSLSPSQAATPTVEPEAVAAKTTPSKGTLSLAKLPFGQGKSAGTFEVAIGACKRAKGVPTTEPADCPVLVTLSGKGKKGKHTLEWTAKSGSVFQQGDRSMAIGDEADTAMALSWSNVLEVSKGVHGLLVTQQAGGDRIKRRHDLFLVLGNKLNHAFTAREPRGDVTWSSVGPIDVDRDGMFEVLMMQAQTPDEESADVMDFAVFGFRKDIQKIVKIPSWRPTIYAATVGFFVTAKDAREFQQQKCLREFVVVDNRSYMTLLDGQFVVAFLGATFADAELALEAAKACDDGLVGAVKVAVQGMDVSQ